MAESRPSCPASTAISPDVRSSVETRHYQAWPGRALVEAEPVPSEHGAHSGRASMWTGFLSRRVFFVSRRAGGLVALVPGFLGASEASRRAFAALQAREHDEMPKRRREARMTGRKVGLKSK